MRRLVRHAEDAVAMRQIDVAIDAERLAIAKCYLSAVRYLYTAMISYEGEPRL